MIPFDIRLPSSHKNIACSQKTGLQLFEGLHTKTKNAHVCTPGVIVQGAEMMDGFQRAQELFAHFRLAQ